MIGSSCGELFPICTSRRSHVVAVGGGVGLHV